ncbi:hypothetical protein [Bifidobacterium stellenboschense]|uniref:Uncharacterized protein n=1 Tax=Bifidobacterium stellenboschense TaxID=762211 RepID=A0A087DN03_9BIFI|nr:hypothetical protein [Bifidobacterium stellenboschense]KFI96903.1 hypothetical protein BSTEL_1812 [Bifidobacterium stellenboschense]
MNSIFNQLLNVKNTVVETVRIVDSPLRPTPVLEIRVRPRRGPMLPLRAETPWIDREAACVAGGIRTSAAGGSSWWPRCLYH